VSLWLNVRPVGVVTMGVRKIEKRAGKCGSPLERGGGVCPLRQAFTLLHGGEHTPATTQSGAPPLKRGTKKNLPNTYGVVTDKTGLEW